LHIHTNGGGIDNLNTVPSTLGEMLLQSFQGNFARLRGLAARLGRPLRRRRRGRPFGDRGHARDGKR
jgi:hypothetical protein